MAKAIIHTVTRVIRRLTTDTTPEMLSDESVVNVPGNTDIGPSGQFVWWKLDPVTNAKVAATQVEADQASLDEESERTRRTANLDALKQACTAVKDAADATKTQADVCALIPSTGNLQSYFTQASILHAKQSEWVFCYGKLLQQYIMA